MEIRRASTHLSPGSPRAPHSTTVKNHIPLGRLFGIRIWLSRWVLYLIAAASLWNGMEDPASFLPTALYVIAVLAIVLLHELGHSVVAQHFGVKVSHITLMPFGGVAWMEDIPEDPKVEGCIAIAGPAVNFVLALLAAPFMFLLAPSANAYSLAPGDVVAAFIAINLMLGTFNLIPAFPMDGGRLLRAFLGRKMDWLSATEKAVRVGKTLAIIGGLFGLMSGYFMLTFVAGLVWMMGQKELFSMRIRKLGGAFPFGATGQNPFAGGGAGTPFGFGQTPGSGADQDGTVIDAQAGQAPDSTERTGGFSEQDIERLEHSRGPLKRDWRETE